MKKVFISQPMKGLTQEQIFSERNRVAKVLETMFDEHIVVLDSLILEDAPIDSNVGLWYLAQSLRVMSGADIAYFCKGWESARGCKIEHTCAVEYGVEILEENK